MFADPRQRSEMLKQNSRPFEKLTSKLFLQSTLIRQVFKLMCWDWSSVSAVHCVRCEVPEPSQCLLQRQSQVYKQEHKHWLLCQLFLQLNQLLLEQLPAGQNHSMWKSCASHKSSRCLELLRLYLNVMQLKDLRTACSDCSIQTLTS